MKRVFGFVFDAVVSIGIILFMTFLVMTTTAFAWLVVYTLAQAIG